MVLGKGTNKEQEGAGSSHSLFSCQCTWSFSNVFGKLAEQGFLLGLFTMVSGLRQQGFLLLFLVWETSFSASSSLARAFKLSLFFKFFKFFIFNKLCTRWSTRVSRVHCTFLSGLLYFFVGSIILFCRVYWTFLSGLFILLWFYKVYYGQR